MPDSIFVDLKYGFEVTYGTGATFVLQQFRGNSCFDPDFTGTGHQPRFFDQYAAFYGRYMVYSSTIKTTVQSLLDSDSILLGVWPATVNLNTINNPSELLEQSYVKTRLLAPGQGAKPEHIFAKMTTNKMRGGAIMSDDWGALINDNPQRNWYWNHYIVNTSVNDVEAQVTTVITYRVRFFKRNAVNGS